MAKNIKVKIDQAAWGREVTSGEGIKAHLSSLGARVAARFPGSSVSISSARTRSGGGRRARVRVDTGLTLTEEADSGRGLAALRSVIPGGHATRRTRKFVEGENKRNSRRR